MLSKIFLCVIVAAVMTCAGSWWIDRLYRTSDELTFPEKISSRSKFRRPILFVALTILFFMAENFLQAAAIFLLALMTATDFEQYMLFDAMTLPLAIIGAVFVWQTGLSLQDHALAAIIGGGIFLLIAFISKGAIGGGDVKLIAALGILLGSEKLLNVVLIGSISGGLAALLMIVAKVKARDSYFAYGPYFALAAIYELLSG